MACVLRGIFRTIALFYARTQFYGNSSSIAQLAILRTGTLLRRATYTISTGREIGENDGGARKNSSSYIHRPTAHCCAHA